MSFFNKFFGSNKKNEPESEPDNLESYKKVPWMTDLRLKNVSICLKAGFIPASSLPTVFEKQIRPTLEIAQRLSAIKALVLWLMVPPEHLEDEKILFYVNQNNLMPLMDDEEKKILTLKRDDEKAINFIGWKFENAWSLAWFFGYQEPDIMGEMMSGEQMQEILMNFSCPLDEKIEHWIQNIQTVSVEQLEQMEDLFYCLHNAVRSAQLGGKTVPTGFDPLLNGGVIHERRHSLTWMLSKGVMWEETDLST